MGNTNVTYASQNATYSERPTSIPSCEFNVHCVFHHASPDVEQTDFVKDCSDNKRVTILASEFANMNKHTVHIDRAAAICPYKDVETTDETLEEIARKTTEWIDRFPYVTLFLKRGDDNSFENVFGTHDIGLAQDGIEDTFL